MPRPRPLARLFCAAEVVRRLMATGSCSPDAWGTALSQTFIMNIRFWPIVAGRDAEEGASSPARERVSGIAGGPPLCGDGMSESATIDAAAAEQALQAERETLLALSGAAAEERRPVTLDQQSVGRLSRMDAMQVQAMAQAVEVRRRARLRQIDAALQRIAAGDYGYCTDCGETIPRKRLEIDLATMRCVDCAQS